LKDYLQDSSNILTMSNYVNNILLIIGLTLSLVINILLYKVLSIQLKKIQLYEKYIVEYDEWVDSVRNLVRSVYLRMKKIDDRDIFFKDDDVGVVFAELLNLLKHLNDKVQK